MICVKKVTAKWGMKNSFFRAEGSRLRLFGFAAAVFPPARPQSKTGERPFDLLRTGPQYTLHPPRRMLTEPAYPKRNVRTTRRVATTAAMRPILLMSDRT